MANYELWKVNKEGTLLRPHDLMMTDEAAEQYAPLLLRSKIVMPEYGKCFNDYQLIAREPHTVEMALAYDIECPECGKHLKQVRRCLNKHELGLYRCPACDRRKGGKKYGR